MGDLTFSAPIHGIILERPTPAWLKGRMEDEAVDLLREGVLIDNDGGIKTQPAEVTVLRRKQALPH